MSIFYMGRNRRETDFVEKLICASTANNYSSDGIGSLHVTVQDTSSCMNIFRITG